MKKVLLSITVALLLMNLFCSIGFSQVQWTKHQNNPVVNIGPFGSWDDENLYNPKILLESGVYKMWYSAWDGNRTRIGFATSSDKINWTKYINNPILNVGVSGTWDDVEVSIGSIIRDSSNYKMYYMGNDMATFRPQIGLATSIDGVNWTKHPSNPILSYGASGSMDYSYLLAPYVIYDDSLYKMWYVGSNLAGTWRIGYATSADGIEWEKYSGNPILSLGPPGSWDDAHQLCPAIIKSSDNSYQMWYGGDDGSITRIGHATSSNGISWTKYVSNPVLDKGINGTWDDYYVYQPCVFIDSTVYNMYYVGNDGNISRIGYATSPLVNISNEYHQEKAISLKQNYPNPFNPVTTIEFSVPNNSCVSLKIYNALGQLIEELLNNEVLSGYHKITWDASKYSTGLYLCVLKTAYSTQTKKLLLIK